MSNKLAISLISVGKFGVDYIQKLLSTAGVEVKVNGLQEEGKKTLFLFCPFEIFALGVEKDEETDILIDEWSASMLALLEKIINNPGESIVVDVRQLILEPKAFISSMSEIVNTNLCNEPSDTIDYECSLLIKYCLDTIHNLSAQSAYEIVLSTSDIGQDVELSSIFNRVSEYAEILNQDLIDSKKNKSDVEKSFQLQQKELALVLNNKKNISNDLINIKSELKEKESNLKVKQLQLDQFELELKKTILEKEELNAKLELENKNIDAISNLSKINKELECNYNIASLQVHQLQDELERYCSKQLINTDMNYLSSDCILFTSHLKSYFEMKGKLLVS
ncbi:hypothetical protein [Vibrio rotiferianus]|uniref:hypothetical protein n=1 Tax=Vibrio rotiferianus TaxID=190895 RepID=UPI0039090A39